MNKNRERKNENKKDKKKESKISKIYNLKDCKKTSFEVKIIRTVISVV